MNVELAADALLYIYLFLKMYVCQIFYTIPHGAMDGKSDIFFFPD